MTVATIQAVDDKNQVIQLLGYAPGTGQRLIANTTSANTSSGIPGYVKIVTISADQPVLFEQRLGTNPAANANSTAASTAHYLPANWLLDLKIRDMDLTSNSYFAFIATNIQANVFISQRY